jgi:hypothetical protein
MIVGLFSGGVKKFVASDGHPLITAIRKSPIANGLLAASGFLGDASAELDHHTADKAVHLFADENYSPLEGRLGVALQRPAFGERRSPKRETTTSQEKAGGRLSASLAKRRHTSPISIVEFTLHSIGVEPTRLEPNCMRSRSS